MPAPQPSWPLLPCSLLLPSPSPGNGSKRSVPCCGNGSACGSAVSAISAPCWIRCDRTGRSSPPLVCWSSYRCWDPWLNFANSLLHGMTSLPCAFWNRFRLPSAISLNRSLPPWMTKAPFLTLPPVSWPRSARLSGPWQPGFAASWKSLSASMKPPSSCRMISSPSAPAAGSSRYGWTPRGWCRGWFMMFPPPAKPPSWNHWRSYPL